MDNERAQEIGSDQGATALLSESDKSLSFRAGGETSTSGAERLEAISHNYGHKVLVKCGVQVTQGLSRDPKTAASYLHSKFFLSDRMLEEIVELSITMSDKGQRLYLAILGVIKSFPDRYTDFVSVLVDMGPLYSDLVTLLRDKYRELSIGSEVKRELHNESGPSAGIKPRAGKVVAEQRYSLPKEKTALKEEQELHVLQKDIELLEKQTESQHNSQVGTHTKNTVVRKATSAAGTHKVGTVMDWGSIKKQDQCEQLHDQECHLQRTEDISQRHQEDIPTSTCLPSVADKQEQVDELEQDGPVIKPSQQKTDSSPITFNWRRCKDIPWQVCDQVRALNQQLYIKSMNGGQVLEYTPNDDCWNKLPPLPNHLESFTVVTLKGQLLVVGGISGDKSDRCNRKKTNIIFNFNERSQTWENTYPALPEPVSFPDVEAFHKYLFVMGFIGSNNSVRVANILDTSTRKWIKPERLPKSASDYYRTVIAEDTMYVLGLTTNCMFRANLPALIKPDQSKNVACVWQKLPDAPFYWSSLVAITNTVLTVGGCNHSDIDKGIETSLIHVFNSTEHQWEEVGNLPKPMYACHCTFLSGELFVLGGYSKSPSADEPNNRSVHVATLTPSSVIS